MLRRLAALVFAVVVIAVGLSLRDGRDGGGGPGGGRPGGGDRAQPGDDPYEVFEDEHVDVLCVEELRTFCADRLDLLNLRARFEPAWVTVQRLQRGAALGADVWLTFRPLDDLARPPGVPPVLGPSTPVLARSAVVVAGPTAAVTALDAACPDRAKLLACVATTRGEKLALRDPSTSGAGTLAFASVAFELGVPPEARSVEDPAVATQLTALARTARRTPTPYADVMRVDGDLVALTLESEVRAALEEVDFDERRTFAAAAVRYPIDVRAAELVAVPAVGFRRARDLDFVLRSDPVVFSLGDSGFEIEGETFRTSGVALFAGRPDTRLDLPYDAALLQSLREVVG